MEFCVRLSYRTRRCYKCSRIGHKATHCRAKQLSQGKRCNAIAQRDSQVLSCEDGKYLTVSIDGKPARLQVDMASDLTIISIDMWEALGSPELKPTAARAWA
uniref:Uncharacterized protein K02A2.6 n=1 Tax=Schistocephalus solidus TaxID=70667 RepID=A0A0X3Q3Q2_SCHSO